MSEEQVSCSRANHGEELKCYFNLRIQPFTTFLSICVLFPAEDVI